MKMFWTTTARTSLTVLSSVFGLFAADSYPTPRFTDPERPAKLGAAMPQVDEVFRKYAETQGVPGMVWGVVIDGKLVHVQSTGVRNRTTKEPVTPDTVFRIASMTKSFTTLAILKLRDAGKLSLEDLRNYAVEQGEPATISGRQEYLENLINRFI